LQKGRQALPRVAAEQAKRQAELGPDDLATIMYTSGTTGNPKGVMLTHGNLLSNMQGSLEASPHDPGSVLLSWLPYSHIYARMCDHYVSMGGGTVVCLAESPELVVQNIAETAPTHLTAVPRFYEKVLAVVNSGDPEATKKRLHFLFGPRLDWLSSGGAPLARPFAEAFDKAGLLLLQGYGLTESSPVISFNRKTANKIGTVGKPIPGVDVKIAPDGEVLTRGPHVMKGYWKNPAATAEAIRDGWLYTGDLGALDAEGYLTITGRKKELLVLSNGKKMVPSITEGDLAANLFIDQALVFGEGKPYLGALVAPTWDNVLRALKSRGLALETESREQLCGHPAVRELVQGAIDEAQADLANWEQVRKFILVPEFSVAGGDLTVSLKMRREVVLKKYAAPIERMYQD
jgi:long-chain acyl-CoA synthetase